MKTYYTIIVRSKKDNTISMCDLVAKWTYKQALQIAKNSTPPEAELVCVVRTSSILCDHC